MPANLLFPFDPRLQRIEEPLVVKPSLNKKRRRKDNDSERSTRRELSQFERVERNFSSSQQRGIRRTGIRGNAIQRAGNRPTSQTNSGNVAGIPTEMTSIFSI